MTADSGDARAFGPPRTATDEVRDTYYGRPVIKPPHWRWLVITYLFLGGIAGGSFTIGTIAGFMAKNRAIERVARYVSWAALIPCPPLLILDLGRPTRFMYMLRIIKLRSPMSLGSWALTFAGLFATVAAGLELLCDITRREVPAGARRTVGVLGTPFTLFLSGYTGILLAATNVPLWWRGAPLLSPTFVSSAYSTSLAAISLGLDVGSGEQQAAATRLARAETICLAAEATCMTALLVRLGRIGRPLTTGRLGMIFWPVTCVGGVLVPLLLQLSGPVQGRAGSKKRRRLTAALTLLGGYSLRMLMIFAGRESAQRPEDYFAMTGGTRGTAE